MPKLIGTYNLPDGKPPGNGAVIKIRVPIDRNQNGTTIYSKATDIRITPGTGTYESADLPAGPYQIKRAIPGAKDMQKWHDVILGDEDTDIHTLIETYNPSSYTEPVVTAAQAARVAAEAAAADAEAAAASIPEDVLTETVGDERYVRSVNGVPVDPETGDVTVPTGGGGGLVEDPARPGTFITSGGIAENPSRPGTFLIGA